MIFNNFIIKYIWKYQYRVSLWPMFFSRCWLMILLVHEFFLLVMVTDFMLFYIRFYFPSFMTMLFLIDSFSFWISVDLFFYYNSSISLLLCKIERMLFFWLYLSLWPLFFPFRELIVVFISLFYFFYPSVAMYLNLLSLMEVALGFPESYSII